MAITTDLSVATNYFITKAPFTYFNEEVIFLDYGNINYRGRMQDDLIIITLISLNVTDCYFYAVDFISISVDFLRVAEDVIDRLLVKRILWVEVIKDFQKDDSINAKIQTNWIGFFAIEIKERIFIKLS